jgi:hypothetical protein
MADDLEAALHRLPVSRAPAGLADAVLAQIQMNAQSIQRPQFRLHWIDLALSLFAAAMTGAVILLTAFLPATLRMQLNWQIQKLLNLPAQAAQPFGSADALQILSALVLPALLCAAMLLLAALLAGSLWFSARGTPKARS